MSRIGPGINIHFVSNGNVHMNFICGNRNGKHLLASNFVDFINKFY